MKYLLIFVFIQYSVINNYFKVCDVNNNIKFALRLYIDWRTMYSDEIQLAPPTAMLYAVRMLMVKFLKVAYRLSSHTKIYEL